MKAAAIGFSLLVGFGTLVNAAPLFGTKLIGPTGDYASLTAAIADVQAVGNGLGGALVLELQATYVSSVETFPLTIPALNGASAVNSLTIRPASGAAGLSIVSAVSSAATVDLNGAQFVTIDGRPGGVGSYPASGVGAVLQPSVLTIANTSTSGVALRFINEASGNTCRYTVLRGVNTSASSGTVVFSATTGANGNDNNTLDHCDLGDGASTPANGLYALGSTATAAQNNSGNTVANCNVFNFYASVDAAGVRLDGGNTDWSITGNSFYQSASRAAVGANVRAIYVNNTAGNNFTVTDNSIGGSAPNAGGTAWTTTDTTLAFLFQGIRLNVGTTTPSSVQGNSLANMIWTSSSNASTLPGVWSGIHLQAGAANIGTVTGNTIGTETGTGSVSVTTAGTGGTTFGIGSASSGTVAIANNSIGSVTVNGSASTISASLTGIQVAAGTNSISNNTVGSTVTASSLNAATSSISITGQQVTGILSSSSTSASITGNTLANLNNNYSGPSTSGQIRGIVTSAGVNSITGNSVNNLSTTSGNPNITQSQSVYGIFAISTAAGQTVSQNTVHSLANTNSSSAVGVTGIYYSGASSGTNVVARNFVHSLAMPSSNTLSYLHGMQFATGSFTARNNMVRVGLKADGSGTAGASIVRGIYDNGTTAGRSFYHNSVYVGGTQTSGPSSSRAFDGTTGVSNARIYLNNIFVNARGNSGGTGQHYAVVYGGSGGGSPVGLTAGGNLFLASGTGGVFGFYGIDVITLSTWQSATGQDASSAVADPIFVNPNGSATTVDLHIAANSPANNSGLALAVVSTDFDGQSRSASTPAIGADEFFQPDIAVTQTSAVTDGGSIDFGSVTFGGSSNAKTFTIANPGTADLTSLAVTGGNSEFVVSALSASTVPVGTGTVTFTVTFTPTATGARSTTLQIGSNVTGAKNPFDINLTGTGLTEQESWRLTYFGSVANSGAGADAADFDKDGFSNLFEYVAGLVPTDPASIFKSRIEPVVGDATQMKIMFSPIIAGRTYTVKTSPSLGAAAMWTNLTGGITRDNGSERTITDTNATGGAKFYRVEITKP